MGCKVFEKPLYKNIVYGFYQMIKAVLALKENVFTPIQAEQAKAKRIKHGQ
jgi:hypothetical protein